MAFKMLSAEVRVKSQKHMKRLIAKFVQKLELLFMTIDHNASSSIEQRQSEPSKRMCYG